MLRNIARTRRARNRLDLLEDLPQRESMSPTRQSREELLALLHDTIRDGGRSPIARLDSGRVRPRRSSSGSYPNSAPSASPLEAVVDSGSRFANKSPPPSPQLHVTWLTARGNGRDKDGDASVHAEQVQVAPLIPYPISLNQTQPSKLPKVEQQAPNSNRPSDQSHPERPRAHECPSPSSLFGP
ncbi:hypothetical protein T484DRAFT_1749403 [Baffinella frigidus]|nr:hypothetical protein T484DRAFT_1749403 [Cryptophyta sp. CCMP2293]